MKLALLIKVVDVKTSILPKRAGDKYFEENEAGQHAIHCQKVSGSLSKGLQLSPKPNSSSSSVAPFDAWQQEVSGKSSGYLQVNRTKGKLKIFSPTILNASQAAMLCHDFHVFKSSSFPQSKYSPFSFDMPSYCNCAGCGQIGAGIETWQRESTVGIDAMRSQFDKRQAFANSRAVHSSSGLSPDLQMGPRIWKVVMQDKTIVRTTGSVATVLSKCHSPLNTSESVVASVWQLHPSP